MNVGDGRPAALDGRRRCAAAAAGAAFQNVDVVDGTSTAMVYDRPTMTEQPMREQANRHDALRSTGAERAALTLHTGTRG